jgi:predicted nicotinamide N-methyase
MSKRNLSIRSWCQTFVLLSNPWLCRVERLSSIIILADAYGVKQRLSILRPWKPLNPDAALGWTVEIRDSDAQTYRVRVRWTANQQENEEEDFLRNAIKEVELDGMESDESVAVQLPYYEQEGSLASTLWPGSLATSILCLSPAMNRALEGAKVLELGSGLGLTGLVASRGASECRLTDNEDEVLDAVTSLLPLNAPGASTKVRTERLDWRDDDRPVTPEMQADFIVSSDVAYYYYLLRPLMDTARRRLRSSERQATSAGTDSVSEESNHDRSAGVWLCVGQANREAQWQLYHNLRNGCYNQLTDEHEGPWPGSTQMLLYRLEMYRWQDPTSSSHELDGVLPIAAILYNSSRETPKMRRLSKWDHLSTPEDEESLDMTF